MRQIYLQLVLNYTGYSYQTGFAVDDTAGIKVYALHKRAAAPPPSQQAHPPPSKHHYTILPLTPSPFSIWNSFNTTIPTNIKPDPTEMNPHYQKWQDYAASRPAATSNAFHTTGLWFLTTCSTRCSRMPSSRAVSPLLRRSSF